MKNTILKYDRREIGDYSVSDYFSKDIQIAYILFQYKSLLAIYKTQNNDKYERISHELYGTTDYWDILLMLNQRAPLFEMSYDFDIIEEYSHILINKYNDVYSGELSQTRKDDLREQIFENLQETNESYRNIYVIKKELIGDAIFILKDLGLI